MLIRDKGNLKSLREIKTHSGRGERADIPYMAFMKISCLEMEKARREKERDTAQARIQNINNRISEIEAEKAAILARLGDGPRRAPGRASSSAVHRRQVPEPTDSGSTGFRIRY